MSITKKPTKVEKIVCDGDPRIITTKDRPDHLCFVGQDAKGKRLAIYFKVEHEAAAHLIGDLMVYCEISQVSYDKKGRLHWTIKPRKKVTEQRGAVK